MEFEFDNAKSDSNKIKHGIDFVEAQAFWKDVDRVEIPATTVSEPRFLVLGMIEGRLWAAIVTYREERVRIISVRRARDKEQELYGS
jgi:hypothetical protein